MATGKRQKPGMRGGKPQMSRLKTVWITQKNPTADFETSYLKIKQIGEPGQFGKAFQCKKKQDGSMYAVKEISKARIYRLHPSDQIRKSLLASMQAEIDIMRTIGDHPYIVRMYETFETKHTLHIIMEECKGGELFDRIKQKRRYKEIGAKPIVKMMISALFYMHDKHRVVHCDLKPDNILFVSEDDDSDIKIIDFGMSKVLPRLRSLRELCGTPYYTAPEIINGDYTHAADMWSVGVITYVMLFGFPPFYVDPNKYYGVKETKEIYKLIIKGFDPQIKKGYGAWFPRALSNHLSKEGMDFMALLMEKDVNKRLSAKEALLHPWLAKISVQTRQKDKKGNMAANNNNADGSSDAKTDDSHYHENTKSGIEVMQFANFTQAHKFKFAITALFRDTYEKMRPAHFENLKVLFNDLDKDKNGKISYEEFEEGMLKCKDLKLEREQIQAMFSELDVQKCGEIEFENLLTAAVHDYLIASDVRLYTAFRNLDENQTGTIQTKALKQKIREVNPYGDVDMLLQIIDDVDLDNNGAIDYEEFLRALHPDFNETPNWFWKDGNESNDDEEYVDDGKDNMEGNGGNNGGSEGNGGGGYGGDMKDNDDDDDEEPIDVADVLKGVELPKKKPAPKKLKSQIVKQGWMMKEGKMVKSWKRRWFVLQSNGILSYYHDEHEDTPISQIATKSYTKMRPKSWSKTNKKRYGIKLYTPHRNWKFLCTSSDEREGWMDNIEKAAGKKKK